MVGSEAELAGLALALGAVDVPGWSESEKALALAAAPPPSPLIFTSREAIAAGDDPLGDAFCTVRSPSDRRPSGATYTPRAIVAAMTEWGASKPIARVVDPGAGSGRFIVAAGRRFRAAQLVAVENDPLASLILRAHVATAGLANRVSVVTDDYRNLRLPECSGSTLFIGNPPYVRHHLIEPRWKSWLVDTAGIFKLSASQLAGLHVHFFLATAVYGRPGDGGALITAAEWLDVNYGSLVRKLFLGPLGGKSIHIIEPKALPFSDAATTAAITCFDIGAKASTVKLRHVETLGAISPLDGGRQVRRDRLESAARWTPLARASKKGPDGHVELGELCHVHRGQVTGANKIWISGSHSAGLPDSVLFPTVTKARELFVAGATLTDPSMLRRVIDIPDNLDTLGSDDRKSVDRFLGVAKAMGADKGFIAQHRRAWWSVGLRKPAPILATYMARRPPAFVRNMASARHINIAHGLYPRDSLSDEILDALAMYLSSGVSVTEGRTYAGGLTKFEPKEMERLMVPGPALLASMVGQA